jgi:hypothetical protein
LEQRNKENHQKTSKTYAKPKIPKKKKNRFAGQIGQMLASVVILKKNTIVAQLLGQQLNIIIS